MSTRRGAAALLLLLATPAAAQIEPAAPVREDGLWTFLSATHPLGERGSLALQAGYLGGLRILFVGGEGRLRVGDGFQLNAGAFGGSVQRPSGDDPELYLLRLGAGWTGGRPDGLEVDGRVWGEQLLLEGASDSWQLRPRARVTVAIPGFGPRPFVADEVFFREGEGYDRNRISAGLRARLGERLGLDAYFQRTDYQQGRDIDSAVLSLEVRLGAPR